MITIITICAIVAGAIGIPVTVETSYYDPFLCTQGTDYAHTTNCYDPNVWWMMGGGIADAREWYGAAVACPPEFGIGTMFVIDQGTWGLSNGTYKCMDRGSAIVYQDKVILLDLLRRSPVVREKIPALMYMPNDGICTQTYTPRTPRLNRADKEN